MSAGTWKTRVACGGICPPLTTQCDGGVQPLWLYLETPDGQETNGGLYCPEDIPVAAAAAPPTVTPALVLSELRRIALPAAALTIQPPNGKTLVNFPTNFFTEAGPFTRTVTLLGQQVTLDIRPAAYTWHFGDGEDRSTSGPGAPYPALDVTHTYASKGAQDPSVDITYEADFRVGNGPTQPVPGTVTIDGAAVDLTVVEARPQLVGSY